MSKNHDEEQYTIDSLKSNSNEKSKTLMILSIAVVIVAVTFLTFLIYNFVQNIENAPQECAAECQGDELCKNNCNLSSSVTNFIFTVLIFLFVAVLLGVYFIVFQRER